MIATLLNFLISFKGGHCDYVSWAPEVLATPLTLHIVNLLRRSWRLQSLAQRLLLSPRKEDCRILLVRTHLVRNVWNLNKQ
jgi:hypothetical protein